MSLTGTLPLVLLLNSNAALQANLTSGDPFFHHNESATVKTIVENGNPQWSRPHEMLGESQHSEDERLFGELYEVSEHDNLFEFIVVGLGVSIVSILGIVGNILTMMVLSRPQMKSPVCCLLFGLAFCDLMLLLVVLPVHGINNFLKHFSLGKEYTDHFIPQAVPLLLPIIATAQTASIYFTMSVSAERYVAVCFPFSIRHSRFLSTRSRARYCSAAVFIFSIIYNIPRWFELQTNTRIIRIQPSASASDIIQMTMDSASHHRDNNESILPSSSYSSISSSSSSSSSGNNNIAESADIFAKIYEVGYTDLRANETYTKYYMYPSFFIFLHLLPFVVLSVFNSAIYLTIKKANEKRQGLTSVQTREISFALMLVFVVIVFLCCNILNCFLLIWESQSMEFSTHYIFLANFLLTFNSSVNFVIYCLFGSNFRQQFVDLMTSGDSFLSIQCRRKHQEFYFSTS